MTLLLIAEAPKLSTSKSRSGKRCRSCFLRMPGIEQVISYGVPYIDDSPRHMILVVRGSFVFLKSDGLSSGTSGVLAGKYFVRYARLICRHSIPSNVAS